ncbi:MAG TPA: hypothetical protein VN030_14840 [Cellvibrio sp.]|nr:hypothetical protein [Cellvibrio sp.]
MKLAPQVRDADIIDQAMAAYLFESISTKSKNKKVKINMECRRKLEILWEERRLERDISEFDFN